MISKIRDKKNLSTLSKRLKVIKEELKLCEGIMNRSSILKDNKLRMIQIDKADQ